LIFAQIRGIYVRINTIFLYCIAPEANNNKPNFLGKILL